MSSEPSAEPLTRNWTPATPVLSDALAATGTMPETVDPPAGLVITAAGGGVSQGFV